MKQKINKSAHYSDKASLISKMLALFILSFLGISMPAKSLELSLSIIRGTILQDGKPVSGARITGCKDVRKQTLVESTLKCEFPFTKETNKQGEFSFLQETGIHAVDFKKDCDKRRIEYPEQRRRPSDTCGDPNVVISFSVEINGHSSEISTSGLGFAPSVVNLRCDTDKKWKPSKEKFEYIGFINGTPSHFLPDTKKLGLKCDFTSEF